MRFRQAGCNFRRKQLLTPDFGMVQNIIKKALNREVSKNVLYHQKKKLWYLGHSHPISSLRPKLYSKYWDFVFRTIFGWSRPQDGLWWKKLQLQSSSSRQNGRFWYKDCPYPRSYAKVIGKTVRCINVGRIIRAGVRIIRVIEALRFQKVGADAGWSGSTSGWSG